MKRIKYLPIVILFLSSLFFSQNRKNVDNMILIPGGEFIMGTDSSRLSELVKVGENVPHMNYGNALSWFGDEIPAHKVKVDSFYIDIYEVTNRQFAEFVKATGYKAEGDWQKYATKERENHPVVNVTWNDAKAYAKWTGKSLPTEAEWEYAAKGGTNYQWFWWGNNPDSSKENYRTKGETFWEGVWRLLGFREIGTKEVGGYQPNNFGIYDILGNVSEWCEDNYKPYPNNKIPNDDYDKNLKTVRGGNWETPNAVFMRCQSRRGKEPKSYSYHRGFRCVKRINKNK